MPLFLDYYTIHEMDTGRIGFAPIVNSRKQRLQDVTEMPTQLLISNAEKKRQARIWTYSIVSAMAACTTLLFTYVVYPAMLGAEWSNPGIAAMTIFFFLTNGIVFWLVVEPALRKALGGGGRFMNKADTQSVTNIMRLDYFAMLVIVYTLFLTTWIRTKKEKEKK